MAEINDKDSNYNTAYVRTSLSVSLYFTDHRWPILQKHNVHIWGDHHRFNLTFLLKRDSIFTFKLCVCARVRGLMCSSHRGQRKSLGSLELGCEPPPMGAGN